MGYYVNPKDMDKEVWFTVHGQQVIADPRLFDMAVAQKKLPVVLVDNGWMKAAGIIYCNEEYKAFTLPNDHRPKTFWLVDPAMLMKVSDLPQRVLDELGLAEPTKSTQ